MKMMDYLGFNPDVIEKFTDYCEKAMEDAGFTDEEIDEFMNEPVYDRMREIISHGYGIELPKDMLPADVILNEIGSYAAAALQERFPEEEIAYLIDARSDNTLVINGIEYDPDKGDNIMAMFEGFYPAETLDFNEGIDITNVDVNDNAVHITVALNYDMFRKVLDRTDIDEAVVSSILQPFIVDDGIKTAAGVIHRTTDEVTMSVDVHIPFEKDAATDTPLRPNIPLSREEQKWLMELTQETYEKATDIRYIKAQQLAEALNLFAEEIEIPQESGNNYDYWDTFNTPVGKYCVLTEKERRVAMEDALDNTASTFAAYEDIFDKETMQYLLKQSYSSNAILADAIDEAVKNALTNIVAQLPIQENVENAEKFHILRDEVLMFCKGFDSYDKQTQERVRNIINKQQPNIVSAMFKSLSNDGAIQDWVVDNWERLKVHFSTKEFTAALNTDKFHRLVTDELNAIYGSNTFSYVQNKVNGTDAVLYGEPITTASGYCIVPVNEPSKEVEKETANKTKKSSVKEIGE